MKIYTLISAFMLATAFHVSANQGSLEDLNGPESLQATETKIFNAPNYYYRGKEYRLDLCAGLPDYPCDPALVARMFCKVKGFDDQVGYAGEANVGLTGYLLTNNFCGPNCSGFESITCARY